MGSCDAGSPRERGAQRHRARGRRRPGRRPQAFELKLAIDTNVLVSATIADGPPRRLLEAIADGRAELVLPAYALAELRRVLVEKLKVAPDNAERAVELVAQLASTIAETPDEVPALSGDPDDDRIIAAALHAGADVLVSGDRRHLLPLGHVDTMRIIRPQDVLAALAP